MTQVPPLPAEWPPTTYQLAVLTNQLHWQLEQVAYDLPRGAVTREQLDALAEAMEKLAALYRRHDPEGRAE